MKAPRCTACKSRWIIRAGGLQLLLGWLCADCGWYFTPYQYRAILKLRSKRTLLRPAVTR